MARIRTVKPEFWTSAQIVSCTIPARLLFIGLFNFVDDGGVHPYEPLSIKMKIYPGDPFTVPEVEEMLAELLNAGLITRFHNERDYLFIVGWSRHQKIDRPSRRFPLPFEDGSESAQGELVERSSNATPRKGREGNGKERKVSSSPRCGDDAHFDAWWTIYPRKVGKAAARKKWKTLNCDRNYRPLIDKLRRQVAGCRTFSDKKYIPHPTTYLNQQRWEDDIEKREAFESIPKDDAKLNDFAIKKGIKPARVGETYADFRRRIQVEIEQHGTG